MENKEVPTLPLLGSLPPTWRVMRFGEVLEGGTTRNGVYKSKKYHGSGVKMVNMGELFAYSRIPNLPMRRVQLTDKEKKKALLKEGDLLFARRSVVAEGAGKCSIVSEAEEPTTFESSIIRARPANNLVNSYYLYYLFTSGYGKYILSTIRRQVAVAGITGSDLVTLPVPLPPLHEQRAIANILGSLDDKIELNRRMNQTLEQMARALFKSWFIDFDPVRYKQQRRGEGQAGQGEDIHARFAHLFPSSFQDSPLGPIPEGWMVDSIYGVCDVAYGAPFKSALFNEDGDGIPVLRIRDLATHTPKTFTTEEHPRGQFVEPGNVVAGMDGEFRAHIWEGPTSWLNQRVCKFIPNEGVPRGYLRLAIEKQLAFFEQSKTGTTVIHLGKRDIDAFRMIVPPASVFHAFAEMTDPLIERALTNAQELRLLAETRDALLPKLLSGEIRVPEAERIAA